MGRNMSFETITSALHKGVAKRIPPAIPLGNA